MATIERTCPNCLFGIARLTKGGCKYCGTPLMLYDKEYRRKSDILVKDKLLEMLERKYEALTDVKRDFKAASMEVSNCYFFLDLTRAFLDRNKSDVDPDEFITSVMDHTLFQNPFWSTKVKTFNYVRKHWEGLLAERYKVILEEQKVIGHEQFIKETTSKNDNPHTVSPF